MENLFSKAVEYGKSVRFFGAAGDGKTDDSESFQKAFDSGEKRITVPYGEYKIAKPLKIGSGISLLVHPRARIFPGDKALTKRGDYLLTNQDHENGNCDISIRGGIWDGNNKENIKGELFDQNGYSGTLLCFFHVKNLKLSEMSLTNPAGYFIKLCKADGFHIEDIEFSSMNLTTNNDGVHLCGFCENGIIRRLRAYTPGTTSDDMVAINADDSLERVENLDMCCGPIRNIDIDDIYAKSCHNFVRILSVNSEISDIRINNIRGGCNVMAINMDAARYCRTPLVGTNEERYFTGVGNVRNVSVENLDVHSEKPSFGRDSMIRLESNMEHFEITSFHRETTCDALPKMKTLLLEHVQKSSLILDGITKEQASALFENSKLSGNTLSQSILYTYTTPFGEALYRLEAKTDIGDEIVLPDGGFEYLRVSRLSC